MWRYEKRLQYPVNIKEPNAGLAKLIISQYGGPDGEMGASMRYLSQRYSMPYGEQKAVLTDIGTEELAHLEMIAAIVHQLTRNLSARSWRPRALLPIISTIRPGSGPRRRAGSPSMPVSSSPRAIPSQICLRIWQQMVRLRKNNKAGNPHKHYIFCRTSLFRLRSYKDNFHTKMIKQAIF